MAEELSQQMRLESHVFEPLDDVMTVTPVVVVGFVRISYFVSHTYRELT